MQIIVQKIEYFRNEEKILNPISFEINEGESIFVKGPNGSGKTTLLRILARITQPTNGHIKYKKEKTDQSNLSPYHFIGHHDAVKQFLTIEENLTFWGNIIQSPKKKKIKQNHIFNILEEISLPPNKLAAHLSAGQKKRLALARLLLTEKPIWILDEPFSVLDQKWSAYLEKIIKQHLNKGGGVILASHIKPKSPFTYHIELPMGHIHKEKI